MLGSNRMASIFAMKIGSINLLGKFGIHLSEVLEGNLHEMFTYMR